MSERWPDIRAAQSRRVKRGKRAPRDNNGAVAKDPKDFVEREAKPGDVYSVDEHGNRQPVRFNELNDNWIACAICLNRGGKRVKAETIVGGYAVCADDVALASQPGFSITKLIDTRRPL